MAAAEFLAAPDPASTVGTLAELVGRGGSGSAAHIVALDALCAALGDRSSVPYAVRSELYALLTERGDSDLARLFVEVGPTLDHPALQEADAPTRAVFPRGPALSLGERKSMARCQERELLVHLLRDPHPAVTEVLLDNPHLTERDALVIASRRPSHVRCLEATAAHLRWACRYRIKRALVLNPYSPLPLAMRTALLLRDLDLEAVGREASLSGALRGHARELLARRRAARSGASS